MELIVEWLVVKLLPLSFFDDELTQNVFRRLNANLIFPKLTATTNAVKKVHDNIRHEVVKILQENNSKISSTIDSWTSIRSKSYYGITAHLIDKNWKMHSLALDFVPSKGNHTGLDIAKNFCNALDRTGLIEKIGGITVDTASVSDSFMRHLEEILSIWNVDFNSDEQRFYCFAHVINLVVKDVIKALKIDNSDEDFESNADDSDDEIDSEEIIPMQIL